MNIHSIIRFYLAAKKARITEQNKPNHCYDLKAEYAAHDTESFWVRKMINHQDWTIELADKYYPSQTVSLS